MKRLALVGSILSIIVTGTMTRDLWAAESRLPPIDSHIVMLYYDDISDAADFYENTLGLQKTMNEDWVKIYQLTDTSSVGVVKVGPGAYHATQEKNAVMLSIVTSDVDGWYRRIKTSGQVKFLKDIHESDVPIRSFLVEDPGGYTVEFFQWLDKE